MDLSAYQRLVFGFHGCDRRVADAVLTGKMKLSASENTYDWLGTGIYFWEHGPRRALEWAEQQAKRKGSKIRRPAVLGAVIQLSNCFDLLDVKFTDLLARTATALEQAVILQGGTLPNNQCIGDSDFDWLRRDRDCFVLNQTIPTMEAQWNCPFDSVRGVFQEGDSAFPGAGIKLKSHIQVAIRNPRAIVGYFKPEGI